MCSLGCNSTVLLCGDFNFPKIDWQNCNNTLNSSNTCSGVFLNFYYKHSLHQLVSEPTRLGSNSRNGSILDLVFCNDANFVYNVAVEVPFGNSDHCVVSFNVIHAIKRFTFSHHHRDFNHVDWQAVESYLDSIDFFALFYKSSVDKIAADFYSIIYSCFDNFVPLYSSKRPVYNTAYPRHIRKLMRKKSAAWRRYRAFRSSQTLLSYQRYASLCRSAIYQFTVARETKIIESGNISNFFNYANRKFKCKSQIGPIKLPDGTLTVDPARKADLFQSVFTSMFTTDDSKCPDIASRSAGSKLSSVYFSSASVRRVIRKLRSKSKGGADGIPPVFLKKCSAQLCTPLAYLYNQFMENSFIPPPWLHSLICPVFKKGDPTDARNYRPIALTCTLCKVMESVIKDHLISYLHSKGLITSHQHGFLSRHSTATNLLESTHDWNLFLNSSTSVDVIYIDFSRAFDTIVFSKLITKLNSYGIVGNLLKWISLFLSPRTQSVVVENHHSVTAPVKSGVPQGSVLGPVLFLVFINDITSICSGNTKIKLFADDLKLYSDLSSDSGSTNLQQTLDNLVSWSSLWQLSINISKCNILSLQRGHQRNSTIHNQYHIAGTTLTHCSCSTDLGVLIDNNLTYSHHIGSIIRKVSQRTGTFFRGFTSRNIHLMRKVWITYIRPLLDFNSCVWCPSSVYLIDLLENLQRRFTKRIPSISHLPYLERSKRLDLEPLELRRLRLDLLEYYKILNNLSPLDHRHYFTYYYPIASSRTAYPFLVKPQKPSNLLSQSFFLRAIDPWNYLPRFVQHADTLHSFRTKVSSIDLSKYLKGSAFK